MKNAIVVFTKIPEAGKTKTRLTTDRGGILTPEEAKEFYEASLLDVVDCCIASNTCDVYICHDRDGDVAYLKQLLGNLVSPDSVKGIFPDNGGSFDVGMQYAADYILKGEGEQKLADSIFILGGDMPALQPSVIQDAVRKLEVLSSNCNSRSNQGVEFTIGAAMVVSADQECGFNILGYTGTTPFDFKGVFYNRDGVTALDMISYKAMENDIPLGIVEMVPDVDVPVDLAGFISVLKTMRLAAKYDHKVLPPKRTIKVLEMLGLEASAPVPADIGLTNP